MGLSKADDAENAIDSGENQHVKPIAQESERAVSRLAVLPSFVDSDDRSRELEVADFCERQTAGGNVPGILCRVVLDPLAHNLLTIR